MGRKRFYRLSGGKGEPSLFVKVFTVPAGWRRLRFWLRASKAQREWMVARAITERGFDVAAPVAVGEERRYGVLLRSFSIIPERPGRDLRALFEDPSTTSKQRRELVESFGAYARRLHDAGVDQDDFSPNNFLALRDGGFCLIDFERCRLRRTLGARRWRQLAKLHRKLLGVSATDRLRFLRAYLGEGAGRRERRQAGERIRSDFLRVRRHDARRAARGALRAGRHVAREGALWVVKGREGAPTRRLQLGRREARRAWVLAHQLERLGLPGLRPVRLGPDWVEFEDPGSADPPADAPLAIRRARQRFFYYGRFVTEPDWLFTPSGPKLGDPRAFRLRLGRTNP
jgi:tRNA A-37 threonylcarbamoyl transferase component Bud32